MARPKSEIARRLYGLRLREDLLTELRHIGVDRNQPTNQLIEEAVVEWLKKNTGPKKRT
jgi:hypothetical protein